MSPAGKTPQIRSVHNIPKTNKPSHPHYQHEADTLSHALREHRPKDVLQFCANHFNKRLEEDRARFLGHSLKNSPAPPTSPTSKIPPKMAQTSFPGNNPFGGASQNPAMQQVNEEDEMDAVASPAATNFNTSSFGTGASFGASPFGASSFDPAAQAQSSFPGTVDEGLPQNYALGRRTSVSAESMNPTASDSDDWKPPSHPKTEDQVARIRAAVRNNFLFSHLHEEQMNQVIAALFEKPIPARGIKVISQGDAGDNFYVVERGSFEVYIHSSGTIQAGADGMGARVAAVGPGGSFGELALMYNAPRAATIISTEPNSLLWALDRVTFRRILMDSAFQRRRMYESFLEEVPLLSSLTPYERAKIADALETQRFEPGNQIIREGDKGESFYILESGTASVYKHVTGSEVLKTYHKGDYFGELALLDDKPRAATVIATSEVKVATLGSEGFKRLLGPVQDRMRAMDYKQPNMGGSGGGHHHNVSVAMSEGVDPLHT
ncbi:MAG: hypothetical protein LQ340_005571 [Diploschistes diacapsis]|nr:MAG: hypothetical protein LQ340_005571 [Diploschistes diacapsis]